MIRPRFAAPLADEQALREAVLPRVRELAGRLPGPEELAAASAGHGVDFATTWLHEALLASQHGPLQARLDGPPRALRSPPRLRVLVVPTLFWREHPEIGGDGQLVLDVARRLGFAAERAPLRSVGGLEDNAERLLAHLEQGAGPLALVSLSKGGLDVKRLLARYPGHRAHQRVSAWANVAGLTGGTPLVDRLFRHPVLRLFWELYLRWHGGSLGSLRGLGASQPEAREPAAVPAHWRVLSLPALPLRGHLLPGALRGFERLAHLGPNDGLVPFWNAVVAGGEIGALWGCDHYVPPGPGPSHRQPAGRAGRAALSADPAGSRARTSGWQPARPARVGEAAPSGHCAHPKRLSCTQAWSDGPVVGASEQMLKYIESKAGPTGHGPAWVARVKASKSGRTIYFNGRALKRAHLPAANHCDVANGEAYWVSGVEQDGLDRHWAGSGKVAIEAGAVAEYLRVTGSPELDLNQFEVIADLPATDPSMLDDQENALRKAEAGRRTSGRG